MPRILNSDIEDAIVEEVVTPLFLVEFGFDTPVRLSDAESISWGALSFASADMNVRLSEKPVIRVFNELISFGVTVLTDGTAGRSLKIWKTFKDSGASSTLPAHTEPVLVFSGEMGSANIGDNVEIVGMRNDYKFAPSVYISPPVFNFTPKAGTVINMPNQKIILE